MSGSTSVKIGSHGVTSWHRSHWAKEGKSLRTNESNCTHNAGVAGSNPAPATPQSASSERVARSLEIGRATCGSTSGSTTTEVRALSLSGRLHAPHERARSSHHGELRARLALRPLGVPGVAAQAHGRAS